MVQRPRTIHPSDAQDERVAKLPLSAAYTYAYLPTVLDDEGRAKDQPAVFNGYLWPLRADEHPTTEMVSDITALVEAGLLCRYSVGGQDYLHDPEWKRRQQVSRPPRPARSELPRCPTHDTAFEDVVTDTVGKVSEQVSAAFGTAASRFDESRIREAFARLVEDVTFPVDPERASTYGQKIRAFLGQGPEQEAEPSLRNTDGDHEGTDVWRNATDEPTWKDTKDEPPQAR